MPRPNFSRGSGGSNFQGRQSKSKGSYQRNQMGRNEKFRARRERKAARVRVPKRQKVGEDKAMCTGICVSLAQVTLGAAFLVALAFFLRFLFALL